ncbi:hypothetical protein L7F22_063917 [Adiantum nelumboides]|nr:hypothetical protein [Adiantum nelumboides]
MCSYYRRFIAKLFAIAGPLHDLTKKKIKYVWTNKKRKAFTTLKKRLTSQPVLVLPDLSESFEVHCDASGDCLGALLLQDGHTIAYESRLLHFDEQSLGIYEKELLAVMHALDTWKHYLLGTPFIIQTDHQSLKLKDRKRSSRDHSQAASRVATQEQAHPLSPNGSGDPHLDRLRRVTKQLDNLSINLIHGLQPKQPVQQQAGGQGPNDEVPRRPPRREYQCHNYGEDEHGMYFCPYPRGYGNAPPRGPQQQVSPLKMRPPPMPMGEQQQQPQQQHPIQILRQSTYAPVPQPIAKVPPLPHDGVERAMNVISCEDKGEEKIMEAEAMPGKQATVAEEPRQMTTNDGANKKEKKRKKKASMTRRKIGIINFLVV